MGIRDDLARTHGGFVGLRELLTALARSEGVTFREAASWLNRQLLEAQARNETAPEWHRYSPATGVLRAARTSAKQARELLDVCANLGEDHLKAVDEFGEADALGFRVTELMELLHRHGITLSLQSDGTGQELAASAQWPDWCKALAMQPLLTLQEAASALAGIDPHAWGNVSDEEYAERSRWETALERSAQAGELPMAEYRDERGNDMRAIRPADFAAWCARVPGGLAYPLPGLQALPATDAALREALTKAEGERDRLAHELTTLKEAHSVALLRERQQRQQAEEVAGDLAGDLRTARQEQQSQQETEAKTTKEWKRLLAELEDIKARHVNEQERLRAAAAEYEAQTASLAHARAEMERRERASDEEYRRIVDALTILKADHARAVREEKEQRQRADNLARELEKLRQGGAVLADGEGTREPGALGRHIPALQAQEEAILQELVRMGYDPMRLPEREPGKPGAKAAIKRAIGKTGTWSRPTVFEKAWKRLRTDGRIAGGE